MYHFIYNDCAGENTISKCQGTEESMGKVRALLYYVHMNMYIQINFKCQHVLIMHFYRLIWFHIQRRFRASLSIRLSGSGQPVIYARKYCTNNPYHKLYRWISSRSTLNYTHLHDPTILHTNTFFAPASHPRKKFHPRQNCHILYCYTHLRFTRHRPLLNMISKKVPSSWIIFLLVET